ncbi:DUF262 domain-containing protein [Stenotrophomonas sp. W1S232]|uniref:DUF262 domain-containing protein n=1 Tax=Stenotrophomonas koreensis TaxID=266128 RepID=A0A7W3YU68_9GAMM|nr:DUF262 domain-containing protein [Stenotrophomonas koreensis]MBB1116686.1 DUF262 domain-containing protein [Stenotrophomonas koreensis]
MQPTKTTITGLFSTPLQYQIPIFQRGYVWTLEKQVAPLWADIHDRAAAVVERNALVLQGNGATLKPLQKHFLGSIVMTPMPSVFGRAAAFEVIDGQQRSTTLQLLLLAFRQAALQLSNSPVAQMIEGLVRNAGPYQCQEDHFKVWPTQAGQDEMRCLADLGTTELDVCARYPAQEGRRRIERPLMVQSWLYLYHGCLAWLRGIDLGDPINSASDTTWSDQLISDIRRSNWVAPLGNGQALDNDRAEALYMALSEQVQIMTLTLETEDDPQIIFETLNARGEPLLASDLVRNFVFLEAARQGKAIDELYQNYWGPFDLVPDAGKGAAANVYWRQKERQGRLTYPRIDLFFFNYTVMRSQDSILATHVFQSFKAWWQKQPRDLETELERIRKASEHFRELVSPEGTGWLAEFARLVKSLDVGTITPIYLALRERLDADSPELRQALGDLASYLTRRAVCGLTTKAYNRVFIRILVAICDPANEPAAALREELLGFTSQSEVWPDDGTFRHALKTVSAYKVLRPAKTCGILRALEYAARGSQQGSNHVPVQTELSVEHVMPQSWANLPDYVLGDDQDDARLAREASLHNLGNLTLLTQPLNSSVSNGPFADGVDSGGVVIPGKRSQLGKSALLINTWFQQGNISVWNEEEVARRAASLASAALLVWPRPCDAAARPEQVAVALSGR